MARRSRSARRVSPVAVASVASRACTAASYGEM